ncbi:MAG: hypothetical protein JEY79_14435 [Pseudodesulfovibrio sp.]|nr:hypothetical protein [Pseudodesulfovibrio sp.]
MRRELLLFLFVVILFPACSSADDLTWIMPEKMGEMHRIQLVSGNAAQVEVNKLHGKVLIAEASVIGRYSRPEDVGMTRPAEVWVSRVSSDSEARRQTGLMVHKMYQNPKSPFKSPKRIEHAGLSVYRFTGMGQVHFIWYKGDLTYWISAKPADEAVMLDGFCK